MSLKIYSDAGCTQEVPFAQSFAGTGAQTSFTLTTFIGSLLGTVYLESQTTQAGVTFASGVGSGFSGLTINALIGYRVIHNGSFRGTIVSNTATTLTLSDITYTQATAGSCIYSAYAKLVAGTDYNVVGNSVNLTGAAPATTQILHAIPTATLSANFGGAAGTVKTTATSFWLKRTPGYTYDTLQVQSLDHSQTQASLTTASTTFASGVGSGFSGLVAGALIGRALNHGGTYRGTITANTTTTVTISDLTYNNAVAADSVAYTIGSALFAPDSSGSPGTYVHVLQPAAISTDTPVRIWMQDTVTVPVAAMNYPNQIPYVTGIEYLA
jgi:hypothetical protein